MASSEANLATYLSGAGIDRVHEREPQTTIVLDMDSRVSEMHGAQEGSAYNGRFACSAIIRCSCSTSAAIWSAVPRGQGTCTAPLGGKTCSNRRSRVTRQDEGRYFQVDATFANPEVYELLKTEDYKYTIRLPANSVLQERICWLLNRPVGHLPACGAPIFRQLPLSSRVMDHCIRASGLS
jgi:hypothetical protein